MKKILALISVLALAACIGPQSSGTDSGTGTSTTVPPPPLTTATNPQTTPPPPPTGTMPPVTTPPPPPSPTTTGTVPPPSPPPVIPPKPAPAPPPTPAPNSGLIGGGWVNGKCTIPLYAADVRATSASSGYKSTTLLWVPSSPAATSGVIIDPAMYAVFPAGISSVVSFTTKVRDNPPTYSNPNYCGTSTADNAGHQTDHAPGEVIRSLWVWDSVKGPNTAVTKDPILGPIIHNSRIVACRPVPCPFVP